MPRYKLTIEYDGTPFQGWQRQDNGPTVQAALEEAVKAFCGEEATLFVAGRTDTGVHAYAQVAHLDLSVDYEPFKVMEAVNHHLKPEAIAILSAERVADDFHARFQAVERGYIYRILNRRAPAVLDRDRVWRVPQPLDVEAMDRAAQALVGHHDFSSFRAAGCQANSPIKTVNRISVRRALDEIVVEVEAPSFLYHQVRNIVGTLEKIGQWEAKRASGRAGKPGAYSWRAEDMASILEARDRSAAGPTAPASGLYLAFVRY
ncbi:MAG: tRNA pseudouridine(38-40) synthase TruA [Magnetovibrionaceae bacterium]